MPTKEDLIREIMEMMEQRGTQEEYPCLLCRSDKFAGSHTEFTSRNKFIRHLNYHTKPELNKFIELMEEMEFRAADERLMRYAH